MLHCKNTQLQVNILHSVLAVAIMQYGPLWSIILLGLYILQLGLLLLILLFKQHYNVVACF